MSDFSDRPFVAGSLIGLRSFAVDSLGRLIGPQFPQVFAPGENAAECRYNENQVWLTGMGGIHVGSMTFTASDLSWGGLTSTASTSAEAKEAAEARATEAKARREAAEAERIANHTLAGLSCKCGFYAYFDGGNDYKQSDRVTALIEGYGVCTVGDRGFRASKARLVAIVRPGAGVPGMRGELVLRNYPDVPVYDRKRDALNAHPLSTGHLPSPSTADDFWTREASR